MKKFTGILAEPIGTATEDDLFDFEVAAAWRARRAEREEALIRHFGYSPDGEDVWRNVALKLAEQVVPAYKLPRGRPDRYRLNVVGWANYWAALILTGPKSNTEAFNYISDLTGVPVKTIRERLLAFKKNQPDTVDAIFDWLQHRVSGNGGEKSLDEARSMVESGVFIPWLFEEQIRALEGRARSSEFRDAAERIAGAEEFADRRKYSFFTNKRRYLAFLHQSNGGCVDRFVPDPCRSCRVSLGAGLSHRQSDFAEIRQHWWWPGLSALWQPGALSGL